MNKERWLELCAKASQEHDPQKLADLVKEIASLLERKQHQREASSKNPTTEERV